MVCLQRIIENHFSLTGCAKPRVERANPGKTFKLVLHSKTLNRSEVDIEEPDRVICHCSSRRCVSAGAPVR